MKCIAKSRYAVSIFKTYKNYLSIMWNTSFLWQWKFNYYMGYVLRYTVSLASWYLDVATYIPAKAWLVLMCHPSIYYVNTLEPFRLPLAYSLDIVYWRVLAERTQCRGWDATMYVSTKSTACTINMLAVLICFILLWLQICATCVDLLSRTSFRVCPFCH